MVNYQLAAKLVSVSFIAQIIFMSHLNKKASIFISGIGNDICSPFFDQSGKLHILYQNSGGSIKTINSVGNTQNICNTNGQPSGACYSPDGILYVADFGHAAILSIQRLGIILFLYYNLRN
jgi:restriction endonuclease S subunit